MEQSLVLSAKQKLVLQQLLFELKYALKQLSNEELKLVFWAAIKSASTTTIKTKEIAIKNFINGVSSTISRYQKNGIMNSINEDRKSIIDHIKQLPETTKNIYESFINAPRDKQIEIIAIALLTTCIFYLSSGGLDFEGGLPDTDIMLGGIGAHRSIFTHSILIGLGLEFLGRFGLIIFDKIRNLLPNEHHQSWDKIYIFLDSYKNYAISALWLGIGIHLLKDTGIIVGNVKPYVELPNGLPIEAHQSIFAANGVASSIFSAGSIVK